MVVVVVEVVKGSVKKVYIWIKNAKTTMGMMERNRNRDTIEYSLENAKGVKKRGRVKEIAWVWKN